MGDRRPPDLGELDVVIGLEVHVQLDTATKMFCACQATYGAAPNTHVCPVCLALPGALPVVNGRAVELAIRAALALGCEVHERSTFARKNYFYPDLPKGYQITQYAEPLATGGRIDLNLDSDFNSALDAGWRAGSRRDSTLNSNTDTNTDSNERPAAVRVRRVHLEEDAGKSLHGRVPGRTAIDLNRAGVPLIEIVTEPDLRSPPAARAFLVGLKRTLEYLGVSDCDMEKGSLRVDANVSVRPVGSAGLGSKTEVKNLNSFSAVERALGYEAARQARVLAGGDAVVHETRLWDAEARVARPMRSKEAARDYRYFPEPDLPPLVLNADRVNQIRTRLPELPHEREVRFVEAYDLPEYDAGVLTASRAVADYFEALADAAGDPKAASNRVMTVVMAWMNETGQGIDGFPISPARLGELIRLTADDTLSSTAAKDVFDRMLDDDRSAAEIVAAEGLAQVSDPSKLEGWVDEALAEHPDEAERLRSGEDRLIGFFVGAVMRASRGKADPERVQMLLRNRTG
ncbi:MAG: Asp-tRNA(Asn)/Glu-tRNA(Gln) amidotransferase subunit GatB [Longimicrobiales bacterium]